VKNRLAQLRRLRAEQVATEKELEPKLRGLHTRLTVRQTRVQVGSPIRFRLELVNDGLAKLLYDDARLDMIIMDEQGNRYLPSPCRQACSPSLSSQARPLCSSRIETWLLNTSSLGPDATPCSSTETST